MRKVCVILTVIFSLLLASCGKSDANGKGAVGEEYVYVPEFIDFESENGSISSPAFYGEKLYYTLYQYDEEGGFLGEVLCVRDLKDLDAEEVLPLSYEAEEGYEASMNGYYLDREGNLYILWYVSPVYVEGKEYDYDDNALYLAKYDADLNQVWMVETDEYAEDNYISAIAFSKEGKVYVVAGSNVLAFDSNGAFLKKIPTDVNWVDSIFSTEDGRIFLRYFGNGTGYELREIDTATNALGDRFANFPDYNGTILSHDGVIYAAGSSRLYSYDLETQSYSEILSWLDSNIEGNYIRAFAMLEDGRIALLCDDFSSAERKMQVVFLTRTESSKVPEKKIIMLGTLYDSSGDLSRYIVNFNKASAEYQIKVRSYIDTNAEWTDSTMSDAMKRMSTEIANGDVDMIDLSNMDIAELAGKGALVDLTPYLEASTLANKNDFVPSVLDAYNYGGVQTAVPTGFSLSTLLGKTSVVGSEPGWTIDDVIALADAHPEATLMDRVDKASALRICLMYSSDSFIDSVSGQCSFDSPEFIKVLEFANRFPSEYTYDESYPSKIRSGKVLLSDIGCNNVSQYQMYRLMFEDEVTNIGFPTRDGSPGVFLSGSGTYGISSKSKNADGAWKFLESMLSQQSDVDRWQFPSRIKDLEKVFEEASTPDYEKDSDGQIVKDAEGNPIERPKTSWGYDDWDVQIYAATEEEINELWAMIDMAKPLAANNEDIFAIISEEAAPYFEGQMGAQEVADKIQSRVKIYVSEHSF